MGRDHLGQEISFRLTPEARKNSTGVAGSRGVITECSVESPELGVIQGNRKNWVLKNENKQNQTKSPQNKHGEVQLEQPERFMGFG